MLKKQQQEDMHKKLVNSTQNIKRTYSLFKTKIRTTIPLRTKKKKKNEDGTNIMIF
jgi:hypothetical protein